MAEPIMTALPLHIDSAVEATGRDAGVAAHYGDPFAEQRTLATATGLIDRGNRAVLTVSGPDRLDWLHTVSSQHLQRLAEGAATQALVLSPHGHVEQHWQLAQLGDTVWLDSEPGTGAEILGYLEKMRFLKRVELADRSAEFGVLTVAGPTAPDTLRTAGLPVPAPGSVVGRAGGGLVRGQPTAPDRPDALHPRFDLLVPRADLARLAAELRAAGARPVGLWAFDAARVAAREPRLGAETDHRTIPHEVGWIGTAVHLDKGCYRGQETVARVQNLGRPPRRLVLLQLSGERDELPEPGSAITLDGRTVGFLGTAVHHYEQGPIALAVIKRSISDDATLDVAGIAAAVDPA